MTQNWQHDPRVNLARIKARALANIFGEWRRWFNVAGSGLSGVGGAPRACNPPHVAGPEGLLAGQAGVAARSNSILRTTPPELITPNHTELITYRYSREFFSHHGNKKDQGVPSVQFHQNNKKIMRYLLKKTKQKAGDRRQRKRGAQGAHSAKLGTGVSDLLQELSAQSTLGSQNSVPSPRSVPACSLALSPQSYPLAKYSVQVPGLSPHNLPCQYSRKHRALYSTGISHDILGYTILGYPGIAHMHMYMLLAPQPARALHVEPK